MWDRRKEEGNSRPAPPAAAAAPAMAPERPVSYPQSAPVQSNGTGATIGKAVVIKGEIYSQEDLYLDGQVEGNLFVQDHRLTVGPNAKIKSNIKAKEVIVIGHVQGDVEADQKITIKKDGNLVGNIRTAGIVIDDEAYFKGSIDIVRDGKNGKA